MGRSRFRLSDMIPNAWFYKLKDMRRSRTARNRHRPHTSSTRPLTPPCTTRIPRVVSCNRSPRRRKTIYRPSPPISPTPKLGLSSSSSSNSISEWTQPNNNQTESPDDGHYQSSPDPDYLLNRYHSLSSSDSGLASLDCKLTSSTTHIILDIMNQDDPPASTATSTASKLDVFDTPLELMFPPILRKETESDKHETTVKGTSTRPGASSASTWDFQDQKQKVNSSRIRRPGIKLRGNSPRIQVAQAQNARKSISPIKFGNKNLSESFAVVKSSMDPQRDFRDSMVEMIVENNIHASKDLEDLLACYLSLNSTCFHPHIVRAFEHIWFYMSQPSM